MENELLEQKLSPMMIQWHACKEAAKGALLLFRLGDFYEAFYDDAVILARELDLTLTKRQEIPMSGVPAHSAEGYIDKLIAKGHRVAIAEQTEDPKKTKGIVKREIARVITPGTVINSSLLSDKTNNYLAAVEQVGTFFGLALLDLTTADLRATEFENERDLLNELYRFLPSELIISQKLKGKHPQLWNQLILSQSVLITEVENWKFDPKVAHEFLLNHLKVLSLDGFGLKGKVAAINAAGAILNYVHDTLSLPINHVSHLQTYTASDFMLLDQSTQRNLELTESLSSGKNKHTLIGVLDRTKTPMGARLLRHWLKRPLQNVDAIQRRLECVDLFYKSADLVEKMKLLLESVRDLERLIMKVCTGYASPRDIHALRYSLEVIPYIKGLLSQFPLPSLLIEQEQMLLPLPEIVSLISRALTDDPPVRVSDGGVFREGFHAELDELRGLATDGKAWLARYQSELRETTGIKTLKVNFNRMFGYYIEVSKGQTTRVPASFERRQTLANAERYATTELKNYEAKVMSCQERISCIESELFTALRLEVAKHAEAVRRSASALGHIDVLLSLGNVAKEQRYCMPTVDDSSSLLIEGGRHPVVETVTVGENFTPNDTRLNGISERLMIITGPNMAGKSTYIRQVALIAIMAHMGSFVPASKAHMGTIDQVFTRVGASDDLSRGQSTFMVEMAETANILHHATEKSLIILDEIGRGTSTYDGISIAWAVAEHILIAEGKQAKTLFATHYWELTKLEEKLPGAVNYTVAVEEGNDDILFLRKIIRGSSDKSYGIHVGRLAGLPAPVIRRAKEILAHLEENANRRTAFEPGQPARIIKSRAVKTINNAMQLTFFE